MKAKIAHRIPLTERCIEILEEAKRISLGDGDYIFCGYRKDKPLWRKHAPLNKLKLLKATHGIYSSRLVFDGHHSRHGIMASWTVTNILPGDVAMMIIEYNLDGGELI